MGVSSAVPECRSVFGLSSTMEDSNSAWKVDSGVQGNSCGPNSRIDVLWCGCLS